LRVIFAVVVAGESHGFLTFSSPFKVTCRHFSSRDRDSGDGVLSTDRATSTNLKMNPQGSSSTFTSESFDVFNNQLQANALKATRNALALPTDISFHRSMDSSFSKDLDTFSSRVLNLANNLLSLVATADTTQSGRAKGKAKLDNQDDVVDNFHSLVVDSMDQLLERTVSISLGSLLQLIDVLAGHMSGRISWSKQATCHCRESCGTTCPDGEVNVDTVGAFSYLIMPRTNPHLGVIWILPSNTRHIYKSRSSCSNGKLKTTNYHGIPR
jgi:hypothetical protein